MLIGMRPFQSVSDLVKNVKRSSTLWINEKRFIPEKFSWQEGFAVFSYSKSEVARVATYIEKQKNHHSKKSFIEEYKAFLEQLNIEYDERYIFKPIIT